MSLLNHPQWPQIAECLHIEVYGRDGGPDRPRVRIEARPHGELTTTILQRLTMACVACGRTMHPIRSRHVPGNKRGESGHLYFAAACPLDVNVGCSRGAEARDEYKRVRAALEARGDTRRAQQTQLW